MAPFESNRAQWPAEGTIFPVSEIDVRVAAEPHPFHLAEKEQARENWRREIAAKPDLFDGRMLLQRTIQIEDGRIAARAHNHSLFDLLVVAEDEGPSAR